MLVRIGNRRIGEWTNVGVILFGADGNQVAARMDPGGIERAVHRGDLTAEAALTMLAGYDRIPEGFATVAAVERAHESVGHAMSVVQVTALFGTSVDDDTIDHIWHSAIEGLW